jgi:hypothetical protein
MRNGDEDQKTVGKAKCLVCMRSGESERSFVVGRGREVSGSVKGGA